MTNPTQPDPTHGLTVQQADALWDAVAIPGPGQPTFPVQHERVCRAAAELLATAPVPPPPADRATLRDRIRRAICEASGFEFDDDGIEPDEYGEHADAVLAVLPPAADRAAQELTAEEARDLADELSTDLYRAQDALAFVGECCDIADREARQITTADVREWLKGARCGRQLLAERADRATLRDRIAVALEQADYRPDMRRGDLADAIMPVLPPTTDQAAVLMWAAEAVAAHPGPIPYRPQLDEDGGFWWDTRDRDAVATLLRRMADEAQPAPTPTVDLPAVLREAAARAVRLPIPDRYQHHSGLADAWDAGTRAAAAAVLRADEEQQQPDTETPGCPDPIECGHEAALGQAQQEVRRLGRMVDEYGTGASALTGKLKRVRDLHREVCPVAQGVLLPPAVVCGLCDVLDAPAVPVQPAAADTDEEA
ncbi:hypothetical protein [Streptomyces resistomycificus]|uniref:Uncharacterized protein n=1 Tax=Streptomyces resistomycificus TaxID=67356 RepID=A0A0L8L5D8_9ACTN|nr:hypothetical protein [Streptomyces resistomycificus]KOG33314.1 hypothetical protein ADK37_23330 [Streptomyces resistomycificus]KUN99519.1 hypothetical protein AQJ84_11265 [Streptomyces resistomycificus]